MAVISLSSMAAIADPVVAPEMPPDWKVPLTDADLNAITLEVMRHFPLLSSSPGIKYADASSIYFPDADDPDRPLAKKASANVIFYPHAESGGIKYAFQVHCERDDPDGPWQLVAAEIRRYVKLDSQDFEVRVMGTLELAGVQAVIEASRALASSADTNGHGIADTAVGVFEANGGYIVSWSTKDDLAGTGVEAHLRHDGNPGNPDDWLVQFLPELPES